MDFTDWLKQDKNLKRDSAYDVKSRLNRVKKILNSERINEKTIVDLNKNSTFLALNCPIRSQLRGAVKLYLEYSSKHSR